MYTSRNSSLGISPLAIPGALAAGVSGLNQLASIFGLNSSDPVKDQQRVNRTLNAFNAAMAGSTTPTAEFGGMAPVPYLEHIASAGGIYAGSQIAYRYAQAKLAEYKGRVVAGQVGGVLIGQSNIPTTVVGTIERAVSNPLVLGAIAVGVILMMRKRGR